ncbi:hypothetical protein [Pseudomonas sp. NFX15]|uniref:hypothetical protein n=1 Tax=Pseudomonas sp. NFX15 TaxID=2816958 RepID=UPI003B8D3F4F
MLHWAFFTGIRAGEGGVVSADPPNLTLQAAASSPHSQAFMLVGFAALIPVTHIYNTYGFKVFSGKVHPLKE